MVSYRFSIIQIDINFIFSLPILSYQICLPQRYITSRSEGFVLICRCWKKIHVSNINYITEIVSSLNQIIRCTSGIDHFHLEKNTICKLTYFLNIDFLVFEQKIMPSESKVLQLVNYELTFGLLGSLSQQEGYGFKGWNGSWRKKY